MKHFNSQGNLMPWLARLVTSALCAALFVCANTNSSCMIHQVEVPPELARFSKIK